MQGILGTEATSWEFKCGEEERLQAAIGWRKQLTKSMCSRDNRSALTIWTCVRLSNVQTASKFKLRKEAKTECPNRCSSQISARDVTYVLIRNLYCKTHVLMNFKFSIDF